MKNEAQSGAKKTKFNVVDAVIIAVIVLIAVFIVMKLTSKNDYVANYQDITYTVRVEAMPKVMYDNISQYIPGQLVASGQYIDGEIVSAECSPCTVKTVVDYYNNEVEASQEYVTVVFTLRASVDTNVLITEVGTQEVRPGRMHVVKTRMFEINGFIETIDWPEQA